MRRNNKARSEVIAFAAEGFFERRSHKIPTELQKLLSAYLTAGKFPTRIAHGMVAGNHDTNSGEFLGYYLTAPSYSTWMRDRITDKAWWLSAKFFYKVPDIKSCATH